MGCRRVCARRQFARRDFGHLAPTVRGLFGWKVAYVDKTFDPDRFREARGSNRGSVYLLPAAENRQKHLSIQPAGKNEYIPENAADSLDVAAVEVDPWAGPHDCLNIQYKAFGTFMASTRFSNGAFARSRGY
jgi:hypothetical protein